MTYKIKGKNSQFKLTKTFETKRGADEYAKETRDDGFKAKVKKFGDRYSVYYFN